MSPPLKILQATERALISDPPASSLYTRQAMPVMPMAGQSQISAWRCLLISQPHTVVCESLCCIVCLRLVLAHTHIKVTQYGNIIIQLIQFLDVYTEFFLLNII